jgi:hypothetical protein
MHMSMRRMPFIAVVVRSTFVPAGPKQAESDRTMTEPERVDTDGPWWKGFYQGWSDHDEGREPRDPGEEACPWSAGYDAGWIAYCCEAVPHPSDCVASRLAGHPAWN